MLEDGAELATLYLSAKSLIPDTLVATVVILLLLLATVLILEVISAKEFTFAIVGPASAAPVVALNPNTVPFLDASNGNSIDTALSESCNLIAREAESLKSDCIAVTVSSSVFSFDISKAPELGKSVVRTKVLL